MADSDTPSGQTGPLPPPRRRGRWRRTLLRLVLLVVVPLIAIVAGSYWYAVSGRFVSTENAYVKAHVIAISPNIDGRVVEVLVHENQLVVGGDLLFRLDSEPHWIAMKMAEAKRSAARNQIEATRAEYRQIEAEIGEASENVAFYAREAARQRALAAKGVATKARLDGAEHNLTTARQRVRTLREKARKTLASLGGDPTRAAELHPAYLEAEADRQQAALNLGYAEVRAPVDGVVTRLRLEAGEWVEAGEPAFGLIHNASVWIEANLKETQLTHVDAGQPVEIEVDAYPDTVWFGRVASISPATGAEFAVLPPQNASGNWVKVVQRLPVRIEIARTAGQPPLRAGMSALVTIDTGHERELLGTVTKAIAGFRDGG